MIGHEYQWRKETWETGIYPVANKPIACKKIHQPEKYLLIYCRSGAGCVLEDTELVGGDIPAILGGGFEINLWNIFSTKPQLPGPGSWRYISTFQVASLWTETRLTSVLGGLQLFKHSFESQPSLESSWDIIIIPISPACTLGITPLPKSWPPSSSLSSKTFQHQY